MCSSDLAPHKTDVSQLLAAPAEYEIDFSEVKGQAHVKRGLEIAAAGNHNILMMCLQYAQALDGLNHGGILPV